MSCLRKLRRQFITAISSERSEVTLDLAVAGLESESLRQIFLSRSRFIREASCAKWMVS